MTSLLTFTTCLVVLCLLVYVLDLLWLTTILFDVNKHCRFFSISKLVNWIINDPLVHKGLKNQKLATVIHMLVDFIMRLVLLRNRTLGFLMFASLCITFVFTWMLNVSLWNSYKHFAILIHQTCYGVFVWRKTPRQGESLAL